jgi:D-alanine--poly(phosphoribitol) ligase subunit 1
MVVTFTSEIYRRLENSASALACHVNDKDHTYSELSGLVGGIQNRMQRMGSAVVGIITQNEVETYAAIIAAWLTGKAYVPINPSYPLDRLAIVMEEAGIQEIFYCGADESTDKLTSHFTALTFTDITQLAPAQPFNTYPVADKTAYILFTSGTTGKPKGVPITFGNIQAFVQSFFDLGYSLTEADRFLQMFELTFDLSVMSFAIPLSLGASFYTLPSGMIKTLGLYHILESKEITFSLMVPSAIQLLKPYMDDIDLPHLRYSQFCGEALKNEMVTNWSKCVPNAVIDNMYGPTEATIYCTRQQIVPDNVESTGLNGVAGIGKAMSHCEVAIFHDGKLEDGTDQTGELCLAGAQLTPGYLNNPEQNAKSFFEFDNKRYYRTGDLVIRNAEGNLMYIGRLDDQVKIQGFRIELAELELAAQRIDPQVQAVAVGVKDTQDNWTLALFVQNLDSEPDEFHLQIRDVLPDYMVPHQVITIDEFPLNSNGKTDRKALRELAAKRM